MNDERRRHGAGRVDRLLKSMFARLRARPTPPRLLSVLDQEDDAAGPQVDDKARRPRKTGGASHR